MAPAVLAARPQGWFRGLALSAAILAITGVAALALPVFTTDQVKLSILVGALILAAGITVRSPSTLIVLSVPGILLAGQRIGGSGGSGLALGDVLLLASFVIALPLLVGQARTLAGPVLICFGIYIVLLIPSLVEHHGKTALVEVVHRLTVVVGGVCVGLALQRNGRLGQALTLLFIAAGFLAIVAFVESPLHGFGPSSPLGLNKNFAGPVMGRCAALLLIAPHVTSLSARQRQILLTLYVLGIAAAQSRNAVIALTVAAVIWVVRSGGLRQSRGIAALGLIVALAGFAGYTLVTEFTASQNAGTTNSYTERTRVEQQTRDLWRTSPVVGVGLRYFNTPQYTTYEAPNNVFDEILAEAGDFGAAGMAILIVGSCVILKRGKGDLATAGLTLVLTAFISGQFDIFWVNGQALPWMIAGAGAAADTRRQAPAPSPEQAPPPEQVPVPDPGRARPEPLAVGA